MKMNENENAKEIESKKTSKHKPWINVNKMLSLFFKYYELNEQCVISLKKKKNIRKWKKGAQLHGFHGNRNLPPSLPRATTTAWLALWLSPSSLLPPRPLSDALPELWLPASSSGWRLVRCEIMGRGLGSGLGVHSCYKGLVFLFFFLKFVFRLRGLIVSMRG